MIQERSLSSREGILKSEMVDIKTMQRFVGKSISIALAVQRANLFCWEVNSAISRGLRGSKHVSLFGNLRTKVEYWRSLDSLEGYGRWRTEMHKQVVVFLDASLYKY